MQNHGSDPPRRILAAFLPAALMLAACEPDPQQGGISNNAADEETTLNTIVPRPQPPISRGELLVAAARAASAAAAGTDGVQAQRELDGRRFEFRIRFGCRGPSADLPSTWLGWSFDSEERTLRIRAMPTIASTEDRIIADLIGDEFEAAEGFWIPRPWLLEPVCPAAAAVRPAPPSADAAAPAGELPGTTSQQEQEPESEPAPVAVRPRVGIAQFFTSTDPRTGRRSNRAYESVKSIGPDEQISSQGYNLVLSGRLRAFPNRGVIACTTRGPDQPPDCIISAQFDRVWIERPDSQEVVAQWTSG